MTSGQWIINKKQMTALKVTKLKIVRKSKHACSVPGSHLNLVVVTKLWCSMAVMAKKKKKKRSAQTCREHRPMLSLPDISLKMVVDTNYKRIVSRFNCSDSGFKCHLLQTETLLPTDVALGFVQTGLLNIHLTELIWLTLLKCRKPLVLASCRKVKIMKRDSWHITA